MKKLIIILLIGISFRSLGQNIKINGGNPLALTNVITLSQKGIASDADLSMYSSTFGSDQTSAIQAILNTASKASPLNILWDCKISCTGLKIKSYTTINALPGCGAILRDGSNSSLLINYNWTANSNVIVDSSITINGGIWNGNGWRGGVAKQTNNSTADGQHTVFNWFGVKNISMTNFSAYNSVSWSLLFITSENVYINNFIVDDSIPHIVQDGIDFLGYAKNITITNGTINNGDDKITFCPNSTGGATMSYDHSAYTGVDGDEINIRVDHVYFAQNGKGFAIYNCGGNTIKGLYVSNIYGYSQTFWLGIFNSDDLSGYTVTTGSKIPQNLFFDNISVEVLKADGYDLTTFPIVTIACSFRDIHFKNIRRDSFNIANPTIGFYKAVGGTSLSGGLLDIDGINSITTPQNPTDQIMIASSGVTLKYLSVKNCDVDMGASKLDSSFIKIGAGATVTSASIANNRVNSLKYFYNNYGTSTSIGAIGVYHFGQGGSDPSIINQSAGTFSTLWMSNWIGQLSTSGTIGTSKGDAFL